MQILREVSKNSKVLNRLLYFLHVVHILMMIFSQTPSHVCIELNCKLTCMPFFINFLNLNVNLRAEQPSKLIISLVVIWQLAV